MDITFKDLQEQQRAWVAHNFPGRKPHQPVLGVAEEIGELAKTVLSLTEASGRLSHAVLKAEQNIRGSAEKHTADAKDAIADIVIFLADVCSAYGWDFQEIVQSVWETVRQRDFKKNQVTGQV